MVKAAGIDGNFVVGATITTKVAGCPTLTSKVTRIDPLRMWVGVARRPGLTTTMEHIIEPTSEGTSVVERVILTGPAAGIAARVLGRRLESLLAVTSAHCARLAESRPSS